MSRCQSTLLDGFTDDWDAALLSEGTLRPKRAASAMNLREVMKTLTKPPVGAVTKQELENQFSRSMKLLGLDIVDSASSKTTCRPKINNVEPRTITRLTKPTVSYEDIRNAVTDGVDRKVLSQAAYERWYFRKLDEERDSRRMKGFFDLGKNRSKLFEHGMTFSEWLEKKEKDRKNRKAMTEKTVQDKASIKRRLPMSSPATKEAAEKAYKEWMNKKKEEDEKKKQKMKEEREAKEAAKSREDAEKAFEEWKRTHDEKSKKIEQRKRNREKKAREKEQEEKERHVQDCEKAFNAWLSSKEQSLQEKAGKIKKQTMRKSMEEERILAEKRHEAKQAFEDWLERKLELEAARAPTPEVKVTKSIQTEIVPKPSTPVPKRTNFARNLMVPWADFSAKNQLTSPKHQKREKVTENRTPTPKKQKVKFADSFDSDSSLEAPPKHSSRFNNGDFTKLRDLSDNKTLMMLYHRRDHNRAPYYARDLI
ncbi:hypothetical protein GE061_006580 [Apolygus lucorum]|uniref:Microtubule-associated protein 9 n=1 Tax=Apolygus lucorum TaxID=248454 RepID=A0A6A4KI92_APOLU|nr:hypothetical protein GE061_006580 [Apolygus lucorum]